jgi:hydrogenase maturation protein HypF
VPNWLIARLGFTEDQARGLIRMIERQVNAPRTSSVGRLFDAVAALLLQVREVSYEGEAAAVLEAVVDPDETSAYPILMRTDADGLSRGDWRPLIRALVKDLADAIDVGVCAARFHNALVRWAAQIAPASPPTDVMLGGGCFQNAYLTRRMNAALLAKRNIVYVPSRVPPNDGGLAVGQLAIGMARWLRQAKEQ